MEFLITDSHGITRQEQIFGKEKMTIGRDAQCDLVLDDLDISRKHLEIKVLKDGWALTDSSSNGTYIGQRFLHQEEMWAESIQVIQVGPFTLRRIDQKEVTTNEASDFQKSERVIALRRKIHVQLLDKLNVGQLERNQMDDKKLRPQVRSALQNLVTELGDAFPSQIDPHLFVEELLHEVLGLGPLENLLRDNTVSEIMVVHPGLIYCERNGKIEKTNLYFTDDNSARAVIERIVTPLGRRIDESTPYVDARLKDGSRVNAVIAPLTLQGACITIRKFSEKKLSLQDLISFDSLDSSMARFLSRSVKARKNILISGGTGSGKTTLLNVLSQSIAPAERIITIEDAAELQLSQEHVVSMESKPPNMEQSGEVTIRDLVRNALRMRPDRILVGECRGGEAIDMLQAMNTGHDGSMTTTHANSPKEAIRRLETLIHMSGLDIPSHAIRQQIAGSLDLIIQQTRFSDGSRRITSIAEVLEIDKQGEVEVQEIFTFQPIQNLCGERLAGRFRATGYLPSYLQQLIDLGLIEGSDYL